MSPLLINTYNYENSSAGIRVMHYLPALLRAANVPVAVTSPCYYNPTIPVRSQALPDDIVVYPDASRGNQHGGRRICRYMLYYATAYFGGDRISKDECALVYQKSYLSNIQAHCDHPLTEDDIVTLPILDATWCFPEPKTLENVLYFGKGDVGVMPNIPGAYMLLSKYQTDPLVHQRTLGVLRQAKNFYTLDENTLMTSEAALCGCKVIFVKEADRFEEQPDALERARKEVMNPERAVCAGRHFANRVYQFFGES